MVKDPYMKCYEYKANMRELKAVLKSDHLIYCEKKHYVAPISPVWKK